jgi:hypothetical protein
MDLKKTGYNHYSKYYYFQLNDFVPAINKLFDRLGLVGVFNYEDNETTGERLATMTIIDTEDPEKQIKFWRAAVDSNASNQAIQNAGATDTYMRRYMWLMAMDIVENDMEEAINGMPENEKPAEEKKQAKKPEPAPKPTGAPRATKEQIQIIKENYPEPQWEGIAKYFKRGSIEELTTVEAKTVIGKVEKRNAGNSDQG